MEPNDPVLVRFRRMSRPMRLVYSRPRTLAAIAAGILVSALLPGSMRVITRLLIGWDALIAVYLVLVYGMMIANNDHQHIRRAAVLQDDGRFAILLVTAAGAFASIAAIVFELGVHHGVVELTLATATIVLSWAAVHTTFALHYAHDYYRGKPGGLQFPSGEEHERPDYWDFVYFSFVIGMTAQVSDVGITDKTIRRTATAHGIVSFVYNTALLALTVNIAASAIAT